MLLALFLATAQVTTVADAADEKHTLELDLQATFTHSRRETRITREQPLGGLTDELHHMQTVDELGLRLNLGLYHDLELHVIAPLVLRDVQDWHLYDPKTSTLANNTLSVSGCAGGGCGAVSPIVASPGQSSRRGFRDPTVGLAWAPVNEERDWKLKPDIFPDAGWSATWVLGVDYTVPLPGPVDDPSRWGFASALDSGTPPTAANSESRKAHVITAWTAFSKRMHMLEPYLRVSGSYAVAAKSAYDNCAHPDRLADVATANCASSWQGQTGYKPAVQGSAQLGTELVVHERSDRRVAFDLHGDAQYHGTQRGYSQVTDALGKLTYEDEYATLGGAVGFYAQVASWLRFSVYGSLGYDTAHFLTHEDVGDEKDATPGIQLSGGSGKAAPDQNPNYDFRLDQVGHRLRAEANLIWGVSGSLALTF